MTPDLWTCLLTDWPGAVAGVTQRGPHNPAIPWSGHNFGHTKQADHAAVDALRHQALVVSQVNITIFQLDAERPLGASWRHEPRSRTPRVVAG